MFRDVRKRAQKAGQPPGTPIYTGHALSKPVVTIIKFTADTIQEGNNDNLDTLLNSNNPAETTWINIEGLNDPNLIDKIAKHFHLHPLTVEDIMNVHQRPKIEEFDDYLFVTLKKLRWNEKKRNFSIHQFSCILGKNFILSFHEHETTLFDDIKQRLKTLRLRQHGADYLLYRFVDSIVDQYFVVLENIGDQIETIEENIIASPTQQNARILYSLKRQMLILRKAIWPMREVINHLSQAEEKFITDFTRVYLRDVSDHVMQAIDTVETFRDMFASMLDIYLSSLTNRMNEVMKILTIIATIFIPMTFIASVYGMNFKYMPELQYRYGYPITLCIMATVATIMLIYFWRKKWL